MVPSSFSQLRSNWCASQLLKNSEQTSSLDYVENMQVLKLPSLVKAGEMDSSHSFQYFLGIDLEKTSAVRISDKGLPPGIHNDLP